MGGIHQNEDGNHRQRYGHGYDQGAARAAEEQHQDHNHQADAFEHRVPDLAHRCGDEIATVKNGDNVDIVGLELLAQLVHLRVDAGDDLRHVRVFEPHDDALDRRRVLIQAKNPFGFLVGVAQGSEIANQDRHAIRLSDDDIAEVVEGVHQPDTTDDEALVAARHPAAARVRGVVVDRVDDVVDSEAVPQEFGRVEIESELAREASEIVNPRDAWNLPERRLDDPTLILRQLH